MILLFSAVQNSKKHLELTHIINGVKLNKN